MDPAEQPLSDVISDRFEICVQSFSADDRDDRISIITANLEYEADPEGFSQRYSKEDSEMVEEVLRARKILKEVKIERSDMEKISKVCIELAVKGHRADISMAKVSKILVALGGRAEVSDDDIKEAAVLCLLHRRENPAKKRDKPSKEKNKEEECEPPEEEAKAYSNVNGDEADEEEVSDEAVFEEIERAEGKIAKKERIEYEYIENEFFKIKEELGTVAQITDAVKEKLEDLDHVEAIRLHRIVNKSGRRKELITKKLTGRYRRSKIPEGRSVDPAFDATVRAAAPYQRSRSGRGLSINIESQDIREKIRIKNDSCSFLFAVDVSGSLIKSGMMPEILNGVRAMLMDSYVQRDKVALLTFRTGEVTISVPFTRSVEGICEILENTECGDGTPLGPALMMIREYMLNYVRKNSEERCYVILVTDGEATYPIQRGRDAMMELKKVAPIMKIPNTEWIVIDSSLVPPKVNHAMNLAKLLNGRYIRLEDLQYV
jgi:magnesium chelatase subunit D